MQDGAKKSAEIATEAASHLRIKGVDKKKKEHWFLQFTINIRKFY